MTCVSTTIRIQPMPPLALRPSNSHPRHIKPQPSTDYQAVERLCPSMQSSAPHTHTPTHVYTPSLVNPAHVLPTPNARKRNTPHPSTSIPVKRSKPTSTYTTPTAQEDTTPSTIPHPITQPPHFKRSQQPSAEIFKAGRKRSSPRPNPKPFRSNNTTTSHTKTTSVSNYTTNLHQQQKTKTTLVTDLPNLFYAHHRPISLQPSSCPTHYNPL